jgi:hypothetical protein
MELTKNIPKIAFLFIIYVIIAGNYTTHVLSCQMQRFLETSIISRHIMGILLFYFFIMMEGGWDFDKNVLNEDINNWASGNTIHSLVYAVILYIIFIAVARSKLIPNLFLFGTLFILYVINVHTTYLEKRNRITKERVKVNRKIEKTLIVFSILIFFYGLFDYIRYKIKKHKNKFSIQTFILGNVICHYKKNGKYLIEKITV